MNKQILYLIVILFLISCEKDDMANLSSEQENQIIQTATTRSPAAKIDICHKSGSNNNWQIISINENAWSAHEGHGDVRLDDQDSDGFVPDNACDYGTMGDCDDTNAAINPNATEICNNEVDDDCDGDIDEDDIDCSTGCVPGELQVNLPGGATLYVYPTDNSLGIPWAPLGNITALVNHNSPPNSDFDGSGNTAAIIAQLGNWNNGNYAAKLCADLSNETGCDWYLPSTGELNAMFAQLNYFNSGDITNGNYWSSSEAYDIYYAWSQEFSGGSQSVGNKSKLFTRCRCVRK